MDRMQYVEPARRDEILFEAVEKSAPVVVTSRRGKDWLTHKSRFLAAPDVPDHLLIGGPLTAETGTVTVLARGERIGVSFRHGHKKCMFGTVVEDLQECPQAIVVGRPEELQELQRRVYYRSAPPRGTTVQVRYWPADDHPHTAAGRPPDDAGHGTLKDLSVGGIRIETHDHPSIRIGQTVVCHFAHKRGAPPITVDATLRHRQNEPRGSESLGLQFVGLETTPGGRKRLVRLARIVSDYQRSNYRAGHPPHRKVRAGC